MGTTNLMDRLFTWKTEFEYAGEKLYMRIVSDTVIEDARKHALLASRKMRMALRNDGRDGSEPSDEYIIYIDPVNDLDDDEIRNAIVFFESRTIAQNYIRLTPPRVLERPGDGATLEEQEQFEVDLKARNDEYMESVKNHVDAWEENYRKTLSTYDRPRLFRMWRNLQTDDVCNGIFSEEFELYILAQSVYTDSKLRERAFTYEQFKSLPENVRDFFKQKYNGINIGGDDVKN